MCDPVSRPVADERDGYEYADDVVNELVNEIERVQRFLLLDRYTAVRVVAVLFDTEEGQLLRLTGEVRP